MAIMLKKLLLPYPLRASLSSYNQHLPVLTSSATVRLYVGQRLPLLLCPAQRTANKNSALQLATDVYYNSSQSGFSRLGNS